ncbi:flagellin [Neorhizobium sp. R1-B]|uniref:flagellin N-terminal helical domain-containing protein n=1 Tax=Neorhizobium TaxID=1525371 RepID=UPI000CF9FB81|nr:MULTISPECIES: flagellin [Neorhizobium]TCV76088.1 flagellin [Neorhizobium sp. S3-V5DH]TDX88923.1 flagellin [Neorhizobium sp. R1-B]
MTSILTNTAAMAALQTLRSLGVDMEDTQKRVSTGLRVGTASDNAAYWSIATTMRSDNGALSAVQDALGLGAAKVDTAYAAMETVVDVVTEIKSKLVAASEAGVDKSKIQSEISQLQDQLRSIASSASFSGENWLQADIGGRTNATTGEIYASDPVLKQVIGSFTRDANGNVAVQPIPIKLDETTVLFDLSGGDAGLLDANMLKGFRDVQDTLGNDRYARINTNAMSDTTAKWVEIGGNVWAKADTSGNLLSGTNADYLIKIGGGFVDAVYNGTAGGYDIDTNALVATNASITYTKGVSVSELDITTLDDYRNSASATYLGMGTDVDDAFIMDALISFVDAQLEALTSTTAKLGSISMRIEMQEDFVSKLTDSIDSGIGRLVDADMNEESTRLKALQTQQQLAIQSLSIANTNSENILSLFRQ